MKAYFAFNVVNFKTSSVKAIHMMMIFHLGASAIASQAIQAGPQKNRSVRLGPNLENTIELGWTKP